jgi:competence protein ComEA
MIYSKQLSVFMVALILSVGLLFPLPWAGATVNKIDINAASLEQLEAVKGVGQDIAHNILAYKKDHGSFKSFDDLGKVKGVGKVRLEALRQTFTVGSTASAEETSPTK